VIEVYSKEEVMNLSWFSRSKGAHYVICEKCDYYAIQNSHDEPFDNFVNRTWNEILKQRQQIIATDDSTRFFNVGVPWHSKPQIDWCWTNTTNTWHYLLNRGLLWFDSDTDAIAFRLIFC
jgi:hypothetical protein